MMFDEDFTESEKLEYYISIGAIEMSGIDEDGEFIYAITAQAKEVAPDLWEAHVAHIDDVLQKLYEDGFLDVEYDEDLNASFKLSEDGIQAAQNMGVIPMNFKDLPDN